MFRNDPFLRRLTLAKLLGLTYGVTWFLALPEALPDADPLLRWGALLWFTTMGGLVGVVGLFDRHPLLPSWRLAWWVRGTVMGGWMGLLLLLLAYPEMEAVGSAVMPGPLQSPWWLVAETALVGALIDLICTRAAGEGRGLAA